MIAEKKSYPAGHEQVSVSTCCVNELEQQAEPRAAPGAAFDADSAPDDPGLMLVLEAWPSLCGAVRREIRTLITDAMCDLF